MSGKITYKDAGVDIDVKENLRGGKPPEYEGRIMPTYRPYSVWRWPAKPLQKR